MNIVTQIGIAALMVGACATSRAQHWAFKPVTRPAVPLVTSLNPLLRKEGATVRNGAAYGRAGRSIRNPQSAIRNPIDAFILQKLQAKGLSLSPPADRRTLIRRVTFDLTGLPPTPEEIAAFVADRRPDAYARVVERLLASPRFGERWAQHWLDVVRFAESNGYEHDLDRPQAWRYRDWVVNAFNADMPVDRFLQMQVAGDLLAPDSFDARVATGFLRCGPFHITGGNLDPTEMRQEWLTEAVAGVGNGVLGLTIGCARCHDHKYDPIPQADYYRLQAFFAATANDDRVRATEEEKKRYADAVKANEARRKPIQARIDAIEKPYRAAIREQKMRLLPPEHKAALAVEASKRTPAQKKLAGEAGTQLNISWDEVVNALSKPDREKRAKLRQQMFAIERELPAPLPQSEGAGDTLKPVPIMHILLRGDVHHPGAEVTPGFPICVTTDQVNSAENPRLQLARWLTDSANPLTYRVFVNRVWQHLFGRGIVATPNDFGKNGQPPSHPELLDWLAACFAGNDERGTMNDERTSKASNSSFIIHHSSLKSLVRLLVLSDTYRQACRFDAKKAAVDPDNRLLWRANRKRLDAEEIRDSVLAANGTLNLAMGGPSIHVPLEPEVYDTIFTESEPDNLWPVTQDARQHTRRSLYLFRKRNVRLPMLALFDQPDLMSSCAARGQTVHALQALTLVNSEFMRKQSYALAKRLFAGRPGSETARIDRLFALALGRPPSESERKSTARFLGDQTALIRARIARKEPLGDSAAVPPGVDRASFIATADLCLATMNLNEFVYVR